MSTAGQPHLEPAWKQEVNRRLAAHKSRKAGAAISNTSAQTQANIGSRAAEAAARVAARYAAAPSYTQMQAEEARMAVRAAEIATKVALEAQAVAESALADLHAATEQPPRGPAVVEMITREPAAIEPAPTLAQPIAEAIVEPETVAQGAATVGEPQPWAAVEPSAHFEPEPVLTHEVIDGRSFDIRWEPDLPLRAIELKPAPPRQQQDFTLAPEDWWTPAEVRETLRNEPLQVEAQSPQANLIEFPRELVATRKMRPRLIEPVAAEPDPQLSIFEVDPGAISTEPAALPQVRTAEPEHWNAPEWTGPDWSGIQLDEQPHMGFVREQEPAAAAQGPDLAPLGLRLMATVVDGSLILAAFFAAAVWSSGRLHSAPAMRAAEMIAASGILACGVAYYSLFFALGSITPGMRYAGIAISTFDDEIPNRLQMRRRLGAMLLSLLPVGLGFVWSVFDEDHLSWHDRISQTYLRKK